jgi:hypothetical protein
LLASRVISESQPGRNSSTFGASVIESVSRSMSISRSITAAAESDAFETTTYSGRIKSVTISPPRPFSGQATYGRTKGHRGTWTGSLVGEFLGRGEVGLTGPDFVAEILNER